MKKTIRDIDLKGKKVIVRVDFNVPLDEALQITSDNRIKAAIPTIEYLLQQQVSLILMSHLGRPKGKPEEKFSLKPAAKRLGELLGKPVKMAPGCVDADTKKMSAGLKPGDVLLLENLRFDPREEKNDDGFAKELASQAEVFVQDAFGTVHRAHASTAGITKYLPSVCGFLLEKELAYFSKVTQNPERPYVCILGGAKVSDKIPLIKNLLDKVDSIIIGGAMAYTFLKTKGIDVGSSLVEEDMLSTAKEISDLAQEKKVNIFLPIDHIIADKLSADAATEKTPGVEIPKGKMGLDIGPMTIDRIAPVILSAKTIMWNGPMGVFEIDKFATGTLEIAKLTAKATQQGTTTIIGGGDTVSAVKKAKLTDKMSHVSTGGGASIELLEGKNLPGIAALPEK